MCAISCRCSCCIVLWCGVFLLQCALLWCFSVAVCSAVVCFCCSVLDHVRDLAREFEVKLYGAHTCGSAASMRLVAVWSCCSMVLLQCALVAVCSCCSVFLLQCALVAVCSCCSVLLLQCFLVAVFSCCSVLLLQCARIAMCSYCDVLLLQHALVAVCFVAECWCCSVLCVCDTAEPRPAKGRPVATWGILCSCVARN